MFKLPKPTLRSTGTGKRRVKYPVFDRSLRLLSAIMVSTMLAWIITPYYSLVAQPSVPVLPTPQFKATDFNPYLDRANAGRSQTGWESIVESGRLTLLAQWETQVDAIVNSMVSGVTDSDSVITVDEYKNFVRESLLSQKKEALANWELQADQLIQTKRAGYSTDLGKLNLDASNDGIDDSVKNALNKSETECVNCDSNLKVRKENQALDYASFIFDSAKDQLELNRLTWEKDMRDQTETGLYQFQQARLALDKNHADFNNSLDQTDQAFRDNIKLFEGYEQKVRTEISGTVAGLEVYLNGTGLFHTSTGALNQPGQDFQNVLTKLKTGLANNAPLSTLVVELRDFMATRKAAAENTRNYWAGKVNGTDSINTINMPDSGRSKFDQYDTWAWTDADVKQPPANAPDYWNDTSLTGSAANSRDDLKSLVSFIQGGGNGKIEEILKRKGDNRTVTGVTESDICGGSGGGDGSTHTCFRSKGYGAFHYAYREWDGHDVTNSHKTWRFYSQHETTLDIKLTYNWYDANADANKNIWQGYVNDLSSKLDSWSQNIIPAIQNWEKQVGDYKTTYTDWKVEAAKQRQEGESKYKAAHTSLVNEQNTWLNNMQKSFTAGRARFNAISTALEVKRSKEIDGTREHFKGQELTRENLNELIDSIVRGVTDSVPGELPGVPDLPKASVIAKAGFVQAKQEFLNASNENLPDPNQIQQVGAAFQQSLTGMMNFVLADTLSTKARESNERAVERNVQLAQSMGFTTSVSNSGTVTGVRTIMSGNPLQIEDTDGTKEEDWYPETEEQEVSITPPEAIKLAATGDLFSTFDTKQILSDFSENIKENSENQSKGGAEAELTTANDIAKSKEKTYEEERARKMVIAEAEAKAAAFMDTFKMVLGFVSMIPGIGQLAMAITTGISMVEGYEEGGILGMFTGLASGVIGGMAEKVGGQFEMGYSYEDGFSGSVGGGFKGVGGSIGWDKDGVTEATAGINFKGFEAGMTYDREEGFGVGVGFSKGGMEIGLDYSQNGGFGVNAGYSKGGIDLGIGWSESEGFGMEAGFSKGGLDLGVSYNENDGFASEVGYSKGGIDLGLSYSEADGFATEAAFSKGGLDLSLGYSEAEGFATEAAFSKGGLDLSLGYSDADGFETEAAFSKGGLDLSLGYSEADGFGTEVAYSGGGVDLSLGYSEADGFETAASYTDGGVTVGLAYNEADGVSANASYSADGVEVAVGYSESDGFGTELAYSKDGVEVSVGYSESEGLDTALSYEKDGVSLGLAYSDADGFGANAGYENNGLSVGVAYSSADGVSANAAYENGGVTLAAGYDADGVTVDAGFEKNGVTVGLGYGSGDGLTGSAGYKGVTASLNYNKGGISGDLDFSKGDFGTALAMNQNDGTSGDALIPADDITSGLGTSADSKLSLSSADLDGLRKAMESRKNAFVEQMKSKSKEVKKDKTEELKSQTQDLMKLK